MSLFLICAGAYVAPELTAEFGRLQGGELCVAPLYNRLIAEGADIRFTRIERHAVIFCGVPEEYTAFRAG